MLLGGENRRWDARLKCWKYFNNDNQLHRDGDKPAVICKDGSKSFYKNGMFFREGDKPAQIIQYEYRGNKGEYDAMESHTYYSDGLRHRVKCPAFIRRDWNLTGKGDDWVYSYEWYHRDDVILGLYGVLKDSEKEPNRVIYEEKLLDRLDETCMVGAEEFDNAD